MTKKNRSCSQILKFATQLKDNFCKIKRENYFIVTFKADFVVVIKKKQ